jgi:hypothetical protein
MTEPLTTGIVAETLEQLLIALPRGHSKVPLPKLAETYRNGLSGVSGTALRWAARAAIQEDKYFPAISRLRELAARFDQSNRANATVSTGKPQCATCGPYWLVKRWRPRLNDKGRVLVSADGVWLLLESYTRELCHCRPKCEYEPDGSAPFVDPAMLIALAPSFTIARAMQANAAVADVVRQYYAQRTDARGAA